MRLICPISDCGGFAETLKLAKGARAMLLRNINQTDGLTNGSMGTIDSFQHDRYGDLSAIKIIFDDKKSGAIANKNSSDKTVAITPMTIHFMGKCAKMIFRTQFPLRLCWASTFHKMQGQTLNHAIIDLEKVFDAQMAYVALSRVKKLENIALIKFNKETIYCSPDVSTYYKKLNAPWANMYPQKSDNTSKKTTYKRPSAAKKLFSNDNSAKKTYKKKRKTAEKTTDAQTDETTIRPPAKKRKTKK